MVSLIARLLIIAVSVLTLLSCTGRHELLLSPKSLTEQAPDQFKVRFETTKGAFIVEAVRDWSPKGVDRFYNLVKAGFYDDVACFRVIEGFVVQFGLNGDPEVNEAWENERIGDDPVRQSNLRGFLTFATGGPNTRTTQLFINLRDNQRLDRMGFSPIGRVIRGSEIVDILYSVYGEGEPRGKGPSQKKISSEGNPYLRKNFPRLDYIIRARIVR